MCSFFSRCIQILENRRCCCFKWRVNKTNGFISNWCVTSTNGLCCEPTVVALIDWIVVYLIVRMFIIFMEMFCWIVRNNILNSMNLRQYTSQVHFDWFWPEKKIAHIQRNIINNSQHLHISINIFFYIEQCKSILSEHEHVSALRISFITNTTLFKCDHKIFTKPIHVCKRTC